MISEYQKNTLMSLNQSINTYFVSPQRYLYGYLDNYYANTLIPYNLYTIPSCKLGY